MVDFSDFVFVVGKVETEIDGNVIATASFKYVTVELELDTVVDHVAGIDFEGLITGCHVEVYIGQKVRACFMVVVKRTA